MRSSPYITASGHTVLKSELRKLWRETRPEVVSALGAAAAEGDRSENAEYKYRKKQLAEIDRRIRYLTRRLDELRVVDSPPSDPARIFFGARVRIEEEGGLVVWYRIVGADETDPDRNWISIDSPVARALLGRCVEDRIRVDTPSGERTLKVTGIDYKEAG